MTGAGTSNSNVQFEYTYDKVGDRTQRKDLQGTTTIAQLDYTYNNNHQLKHLTQSGVGLTTQDIDFTYDKLSQLRKIDRSVASNPGHLVTDYQYDGAGRLFDLTNKFKMIWACYRDRACKTQSQLLMLDDSIVTLDRLVHSIV